MNKELLEIGLATAKYFGVEVTRVHYPDGEEDLLYRSQIGALRAWEPWSDNDQAAALIEALKPRLEHNGTAWIATIHDKTTGTAYTGAARSSYMMAVARAAARYVRATTDDGDHHAMHS